MTRVSLLLALAACHGPDDPVVPDPPVVDHVVISTPSHLLVGVLDTHALEATAYDAAGDVILDATFTWRSDDDAVVSVSADGMLQAEVEAGSTAVYAEADGVSSGPTTAWVATVPDGALLFDDAQLVADPVLLSAEGPFLLGTRFEVVLADVDAPAPGTIVLARQRAPVAGRVVSAVDGAEGVTIELEAVALSDLFVDLNFELHDSAVAQPLASPLSKFNLGAFECETASKSTSKWPDPQLTNSLTNDLVFTHDIVLVQDNTVLQHALVEIKGRSQLDLSGKIEFPLDWEGSIGCERDMGALSFPLPIPGPLQLVLRANVPLGVGFAGDGSFAATAVTFEAEGFVRADVDLGFEYTPAGGFRTINTVTPTHGLRVNWDTPALIAGATVKASLFPYLSAKLNIGHPFSSLIGGDLELAQLKAGVKGEYEITAPIFQVIDPNTASKYSVSMHSELSPGADYSAFLGLFGVTVGTLTFDAPPDVTVFNSPVGTSTIDPPTIEEGKAVTLTTDLDPASVNFVDGYNVDSVHVWRDDPVDGWEEVAEIPPASDGQTSFEWDWIPTAADEAAGEAEFAFYTETEEMPGTLLEVEPDSRQDLGAPMTVTVIGGDTSTSRPTYTQCMNWTADPDDLDFMYLDWTSTLPVTLQATCALPATTWTFREEGALDAVVDVAASVNHTGAGEDLIYGSINFDVAFGKSGLFEIRPDLAWPDGSILVSARNLDALVPQTMSGHLVDAPPPFQQVVTEPGTQMYVIGWVYGTGLLGPQSGTGPLLHLHFTPDP